MPKKFVSENSKAAQAKAKKQAAADEAKEKKAKEEEDEYWADDDKHVNRKLQRKEDKEKKRLEQLERKQVNKSLADSEMESLKGKIDQTSKKLTRTEIANRAATFSAPESTGASVAPGDDILHLEENINRLTTEGSEARTVDEAVQILSEKEKLEKHPEKRMKAAYTAYEATNLPRLKIEHPNLRLSQLKQILKKDWMKSPENPFNAQTQAYNIKS